MIEKNVVLSSSLFAVSTKKAKIMAALMNPLNAELIQQSVSDLPDDTVAKLNESDNQEPDKDGASPASEGTKSITSDPKPIKFKVADHAVEKDTTALENDDSSKDSDNSVETNPVNVTSSVSVDCVVLDAEVIKSTLNGRDDTCGVVSSP